MKLRFVVLASLLPIALPSAARADRVSGAPVEWVVPAVAVAPATPVRSCTTPVRSPESVRMRPTQQAPGSRGTMILVQPSTPFGVAVDPEGRQTYDVTVEVGQLRRREGRSYVVWAATPELDQSVRLGLLDDADSITGRVGWNKFLVFVSEEESADGDAWAGPILLTGLSPSGRMHTMAGHGPFEDVSCSDFIY